MVLAGGGGRESDESTTATASTIAPHLQSQPASSTITTSGELPITASTFSDPTPTAAVAPTPPLEEQQEEQKEEQQQQQQQQQEKLPQLGEQQPPPQNHEPQSQPPPSQQNGTGREAETNTTNTTATPESESDMASHRPAALHGLHAGYPTSSSSSPIYASHTAGLPTTQYASYPAATAATQPDAYRVSPVNTPQMSLPSMRTIDAMSQQSVPPIPHHSMSMAMSMPLTAVSAPPSYYTGHSASLPSNYGFSQDSLSRYPLPHDARLINHRGPKKVRITERGQTRSNWTWRMQLSCYLPELELIWCHIGN
jgi:hypothetical protein